jgi:fatty acid desaturase
MVGGIPHQTWKYSHLKHHIHVNDKPIHGQTKDPVSVFQKGQNGQVENFWKFSFGMTKLSLKNMIYFPKYNSKQVNNKKIIAEILCFDAYFLTFFILDFKLGLYMAVVYFLAFFLNGATSYGEHWGVLDRRGDTTQDSIGIYSTWYNIVGFGAGFHQEHHNSPGMHWTKLHTLTDKMHPDRVTRSGMHITNCPYWDHFKLLFKKQ